MKYFALSAVVAFAFATTQVQAQVNPVSGESGTEYIPGAAETIPGSAEPVILPNQSRAGAPAVLDPEEPVIKNVAQLRDKKLGKMVNGYYQMDGNRDWGTNARLNGYGYETYVPKTYYPEYDAPIYPAGVNEEDTTQPETYSTDSWGEPIKTDSEADKAKEKNTTPDW